MKNSTAIVLFCDDFRINDNQALHQAVQNYANVVLVYVYAENYLGRNLGAASKVFLHYALKSFQNLLHEKYSASLVIRAVKDVNDIAPELLKIHSEHNFEAIFAAKSYIARQIKTQEQITQTFEAKNVKTIFTKGKIIFDTADVKQFKIFTPFSKHCFSNLHLLSDMAMSHKTITSKHNLASLSVDELGLLPTNQGRWAQKMMQFYETSYDKIEENFVNFITQKLHSYAEERNNLEAGQNSAISPFLRFGMLSPNWCFNFCLTMGGGQNQFALELLWRDFSYHTAYHNPQIETEEIRPIYKNFRWNNDLQHLKLWQKGQTGFDIVDAAMNQLYTTGTMHGRARMISASFLIKDLLCNWKLGEQWFWDTLADADPAINPFSWQWVFGSGLDGAPYFRIFNPHLQAQRFDPNFVYRKKWLKPSNHLTPPIVCHNLQSKETMLRYKVALR